MDEVVLRRVVGVLTLAIAAFLLSWLLPRPGLERLRGEGERVVTVDLTRPDAIPQELGPPSEASPPAPSAATTPAPTTRTEPAPPAPPEAVEVVPPPPAPKPVEAPEPVEPPKPVESPKPVAPPKPPASKPAPSRPAESRPVAPQPAPPRPAATTNAPSGGGSGQVMVQAGAYSHLDKAEQVRARAVAQGQRCVISPAETAKGTLYRLRCGPYADAAQAQAAIKKLGAAGIAAQIVSGGR